MSRSDVEIVVPGAIEFGLPEDAMPSNTNTKMI
jgi:hypothetical protein